MCNIFNLAIVVKDVLKNIMVISIWSESVADSVVEPSMRGINFELKSYHNSWKQFMLILLMSSVHWC